jgi:hypothetical protein
MRGKVVGLPDAAQRARLRGVYSSSASPSSASSSSDESHSGDEREPSPKRRRVAKEQGLHSETESKGPLCETESKGPLCETESKGVKKAQDQKPRRVTAEEKRLAKAKEAEARRSMYQCQIEKIQRKPVNPAAVEARRRRRLAEMKQRALGAQQARIAETKKKEDEMKQIEKAQIAEIEKKQVLMMMQQLEKNAITGLCGLGEENQGALSSTDDECVVLMTSDDFPWQ